MSSGSTNTDSGGAPAPSHRERLPPRNLTLLYLGFAYLCLATAFLTLAITPQSVGGFFYHPKMLAVVHLVTLGWISSSILGALYLIGPIALRTVMPAGKSDYAAWALVVIGVLGMVVHFWIDRYSGMVWSAGTLQVGIAYVAWRGISAITRAPIDFGVKLHIVLAFVNIVAAGFLGMLIGLEKQLIHVLPGYVLDHVYAHAHLAALGWATMMVMGTAYRLFPMVLPAAMPKNAGTWLSAVFLEAGLVGLLVSLPAGWRPVRYGSVVLVILGLGTFFYEVAWMKWHPKPAPKALARPDFATLHLIQAMMYLAITAGFGIVLSFTAPAAWKISAAMAYGVFGLLGFLAQMVLGIAARILPTFAWMHYYVAADFKVVPPSQYTMHSRTLQIAGFLLWTLGVPGLAYGLTFDDPSLVGYAGWVLLAALVCNAVNGALIVRHAFADPREAEQPA